MNGAVKADWISCGTEEPGDRFLDLPDRGTVEIGPAADGWWSVTVVHRDPTGGVASEESFLVTDERKAVRAAERIQREAYAGEYAGEQAGASAPEQGVQAMPVLDTFHRERLTTEALRAMYLPRTLLLSTVWSNWQALAPVTVLAVAEDGTVQYQHQGPGAAPWPSWAKVNEVRFYKINDRD